MKTAEQATAELKSVVTETFAEIEKLMDKGMPFQTALMTICRERPDLIERENSLRDYIKHLGRDPFGMRTLDIKASFEQSPGSISCSTQLEGAAKRLPIAMIGVRYKGKQKIEITRPMLEQVAANFRKRDTGEVPIDYDHAIEVAAGSGPPVPAAGWIKSIDDTPDAKGILWGSVEWTPKAAKMIAAKEYKYISPVLDPGVRDNKTGQPQGWTLTSAALTNQPVLQGMPALVLSAAGSVDGTGREVGQVNSNYSNGWNEVQTEIDRRTRQMLASNPLMGYQTAFTQVMRDDPKLATQRWDAIQVQITDRVKAMMAANKELSYGVALAGVLRDNSNLAREYREARMGTLSPITSSPPDDQLGVEIGTLVKDKTSEGIEASAALRAVLSERPDLARRYKDTMR